jgi:hemoglobin
MRKAPYQMIGGEAGVEQLVKSFYDIVEKDPAGASLLAMHNHGHGLAHAREAQFEFYLAFLVAQNFIRNVTAIQMYG